MRIHIQNPLDDPLFIFTRSQWDEAAERAGAVGAGHALSIGESADEFARAMGAAEALITDTETIRRLMPVAAPKLRLVFATSAGLDMLAPFDWLPPDAVLLNNRGVHAAKAGEFAIMAVLMLASGIPAMITAQRAGRWEKRWGRVLDGARATVVGLGSLGGAAAGQARRFGMRVSGVRTRAGAHPDCERVVAVSALDQVLEETDFLLLACPLTETTRGLIDRRRIGLLPRGAGLVNIGRGGLLDQDALCDALERGHLGGAVLDVFAPEPVPAGHRLWTTPNLVMSPHTAADDPATYNPRSLDLFFANLRALAQGRALPNRFDTTRGY
ncbi:MAG: D-2-hydroxyacid dehydrogenase [Alphaproteobacteria bacterium]|nr:D-2-hydroxyacid dehydrogenase [Alphaproteobacteria bacterium]